MAEGRRKPGRPRLNRGGPGRWPPVGIDHKLGPVRNPGSLPGRLLATPRKPGQTTLEHVGAMSPGSSKSVPGRDGMRGPWTDGDSGAQSSKMVGHLCGQEVTPRDQRLRAVSAHPAPQFGRKTRGSCSDDLRESSRARRPQGHRQRTKPQVSYSMRRPLIARAMTSCWICSVPSKMS
jgi:hypothetical protein